DSLGLEGDEATGVLFFPSGRRHTRSKRDWSSDVCSSDLASILWKSADNASVAAEAMGIAAKRIHDLKLIDNIVEEPMGAAHSNQIGRASCRERVESAEGTGGVH